MLTPKQKAFELFTMVYKINTMTIAGAASIQRDMCKQIAINIAVEIIKTIEKVHKPEYTSFDCLGGRTLAFDSQLEAYANGEKAEAYLNGYEMMDYYEEVKIEIAKIKI